MSNPQFTFPATSFLDGSLLTSWRNAIRETTLKAQLQKLKDSGRFDCFKLKWHPTYDSGNFAVTWPVTIWLFWDSDVAKWIEGACYFLTDQYDADIDAAVQELTTDIRGAQQDDGYLNVHYTVIDPKKRWTNLRDMHELYNAGHLIEAAIAHNKYYKNDLLLAPIIKYVQYIHSVFGPGEKQLHGYPGHPEIELALVRLYTLTNSPEALELARYFITERGNPVGQDGMHYFEWEEKQRGDMPFKRPNHYPEAGAHWYGQAHQPIHQQVSVQGHSVRAMYLLTAVADLVCADKLGDEQVSRSTWLTALDRLWNNLVNKKMYLTGGVGAIKSWEGFGPDYFLPQGTDEGGCYAETCACIGVMMLAQRLLHFDRDARYADVMELCLYNGVMTAMDVKGEAFTYTNQLASSDEDPSRRFGWFEVACCPPNLMRLFGSLGGYVWDYEIHEGQVSINVHLYTSARLTINNQDDDAAAPAVVLEQRSNWPWDKKIDFTLSAASPSLELTIRLRIPGWANGKFKLTPDCAEANLDKGYLVLPPSYTSQHGSKFQLEIGGFEPRCIAPHPYANQNILTIARGPIVYCVEDFDNPWVSDHFKNTVIVPESPIQEHTAQIEGVSYVRLKSIGWQRPITGMNGPFGEAKTQDVKLGEEHELVFVPFFLRSNRGGKGQMRVGLLRK